MKSLTKILLILFFLSISSTGFSQNKINRSKQELKGGGARSHNSDKSSSSSDVLTDPFFIELFFRVFYYVSYNGLIGNYSVENHLYNNLSRYPYYNNVSGNYEISDSGSYKNKIRLDLQEKFLFVEPNLYGNHLKVKFRVFQYFSLQSDYYQLVEYYLRHDTNSYLSLFNFDFCYDRLRFEKFNLGWTIGGIYVANNVNEWGFSCGLNTEIFLLKNYSLFGSARFGEINRVPVNEFEIEVKYHKKNYFFSFGYEHLKIGTPLYNFISVGGGIYL